MTLFWKREKQVRRLITEYFRVVDRAMSEFEAAMAFFLEGRSCNELIEADARVHKCESKADDLRIEIEKLLYKRALLPESRGDLLGLLESFDRIPNIAENVTFTLSTECTEFPEKYRDRLEEMLAVNIEAYALVRDAVDKLFENPDAVEAVADLVDEKESASDRIEKPLLRDLFASTDIDRADLILIRDLITQIGDISDHAEHVARRLGIISFKGRI